MTKWQLKPRVKKRTHYAKCDVFGFSCFFIFFFIVLTQKRKKKKIKKNTLCKMKKKKCKINA